MDNKFYIYFHINPLTNKIFYVGKGKHRRAWVKYGRSKYWNNIVKKYGYIIDLVEENLTEEQSLQREKFYIQKIGRENLCNLTDGGDGMSGYICSEEKRKKLSDIKGQKHHFYGKKHNENTLSKMSEIKKGKKFTEDTRKKMADKKKGENNFFYNKKRPDHSKKMSQNNPASVKIKFENLFHQFMDEN